MSGSSRDATTSGVSATFVVDDEAFRTPASLANWLIAICLAGGAALHTALLVAGTFLADPYIRERWEPGLLASLEAERAARVADDDAKRLRRRERALRGAATRRARS